ncbi:MAG: apolipoprotein N-acyltransferase [Hyphomicrobiales bacterium]
MTKSENYTSKDFLTTIFSIKRIRKIHLVALSVLSGLLLSFAWPVGGFAPLLFIGFIPLFFVEDYICKNPIRFAKFASFRYAYLAFVVWNVLDTYWIYNSTVVGAILAFLLNSAFMAITFQVFHFVKKRLYSNKGGWTSLVAVWIAFEYLHFDWDLSWPWLDLGNGFASYHKWIQWYEYTGVLGGSTWILLSNILIFKLITSFYDKELNVKSKALNRILTPVVIIIPIVISFIIYSNTEDQGDKASIIVTQPNVDPYTEEFVISYNESINRNLIAAKEYLNDSTVLIACPESAIQDYIWENYLTDFNSVDTLQQFVNKYPELSLIIGASTFYEYSSKVRPTNSARLMKETGRYYEAYNTALFLRKGVAPMTYHKSKLVPGVEKMPFPHLTKPLQDLAFDLGGTVSTYGPNKYRTVFHSNDPRFKFAPIICYESIYGEFVSRYVRNGANILVIITNDGWWGNTAGHRQHFEYARLRAIETRRGVARSANTGTSGFFNQRGDIIKELGYEKYGALQHDLRANNELTFYVKHGDYLGKMFTFISFFIILTSIVRWIINRKKKTAN